MSRESSQILFWKKFYNVRLLMVTQRPKYKTNCCVSNSAQLPDAVHSIQHIRTWVPNNQSNLQCTISLFEQRHDYLMMKDISQRRSLKENSTGMFIHENAHALLLFLQPPYAPICPHMPQLNCYNAKWWHKMTTILLWTEIYKKYKMVKWPCSSRNIIHTHY